MANTPNTIDVLLNVTGITGLDGIKRQLDEIEKGGLGASKQKSFQPLNIPQLKTLANNNNISKSARDIVNELIKIAEGFDTLDKAARKAADAVTDPKKQQAIYKSISGKAEPYLKAQASLATKRLSDQLKSDVDLIGREKKALTNTISKQIRLIDSILSQGFISAGSQARLNSAKNRLQAASTGIAGLSKETAVNSRVITAVDKLSANINKISAQTTYRAGVAERAAENARTNLANAKATQASTAASVAQKRAALAEEQTAKAILADVSKGKYSRRLYNYAGVQASDQTGSTVEASKATGQFSRTQRNRVNKANSDRQLRDLYDQTVEAGNNVVSKLQSLESRASAYGSTANLGAAATSQQVASLTANRSGFLSAAQAARSRLIATRRQSAFQKYTAETGLSGQAARTGFAQLARNAGGYQKFLGITTDDIRNELIAGGQSFNFEDPNILRSARGQAAQSILANRQQGRNQAIDRASGLSAAKQAVRLLTSKSFATDANSLGVNVSGITGRANLLIDKVSRQDPKGLTPKALLDIQAEANTILSEAQAVATSVRQNRETVQRAAQVALRTRSEIEAALRVANTNRESIPESVRTGLVSQRDAANRMIDASKGPITNAVVAQATSYKGSSAFTADQLLGVVRGEFAAQQNRNALGKENRQDSRSTTAYEKAVADLESALNVRGRYINQLGARQVAAKRAGATNLPDIGFFGIPEIEQRLSTLQAMGPQRFAYEVKQQRRALGSQLYSAEYESFLERQRKNPGFENIPEREQRKNFGAAVRNAGGIFKFAGINENEVTQRITSQMTRVPNIADAQESARAYSDLDRALRGVTRESESANKAFRQQQRQLRSLNVDARTFGDQIGLAVRRFGAFAVGTGGIFALVGALRTATDESLKLERAQTRLAQILGISRKSAEPIVRSASLIGTSTGTSASETLKGIDFLAQAGFKDQGQLIKTGNLLSRVPLTATFGDIGETVDGLLALNNQFNRSLSDTEAIFDTLNQVAGDYAVEVKDIFDAIKRGGSTFAEAGGDLNDYIKLVTLVRSSSRENAETIGNFFKSISFRLLRPQNLEILKGLGVNTKGGISDILTSTATVFGERFGSGDQLKGNKEAINLAGQIAGLYQGGRFLTAIDAINKDAGKIDASFAKAPGSFNRETEKALGDITVSFKRIQQSFAAFAKEIVGSESTRLVGQGLASLSEGIAKSSKVLAPLLLAIGAIGVTSAIPAVVRGGGAALKRFTGRGISPQASDLAYEMFPIRNVNGVDINQRARTIALDNGQPFTAGSFFRGAGRRIKNTLLFRQSQDELRSLSAEREAAIIEENYLRERDNRRALNPREEQAFGDRFLANERRNRIRRRLTGGAVVGGIIAGIAADQYSQYTQDQYDKNPTLDNKIKNNNAGVFSGLVGAVSTGVTVGSLTGNPLVGAATALILGGKSAFDVSRKNEADINNQIDQDKIRAIQFALKNDKTDFARRLTEDFSTGQSGSSEGRAAAVDTYVRGILNTPLYKNAARTLVKENVSNPEQVLLESFLRGNEFLKNKSGEGSSVSSAILGLFKQATNRTDIASQDLRKILGVRSLASTQLGNLSTLSGIQIDKLTANTSDIGGFSSNFTSGLERTNQFKSGYGFNAPFALARLAEIDSAAKGYAGLGLTNTDKVALQTFLKTKQDPNEINLKSSTGFNEDKTNRILNFATSLSTQRGQSLADSLESLTGDFTFGLETERQGIDDERQKAFQRRVAIAERQANIIRSSGASQLALTNDSVSLLAQSRATTGILNQNATNTLFAGGRLSQNDLVSAQLRNISGNIVGTLPQGLTAATNALAGNAALRVANADDPEKLLALKSEAIVLENKYNEEKRRASATLQILDKNVAAVNDKFSILQQQLEKQRAFQEGAAGTNSKFTGRDRNTLRTAQSKLLRTFALSDTIAAGDEQSALSGLSTKELSSISKLLKDPRLSGLSTKSLGINSSYTAEELARIIDTVLGQRNIVDGLGQLLPASADLGTTNSGRSRENNAQRDRERRLAGLSGALSTSKLDELEKERSKYLEEQNNILEMLTASNLVQIDVLRMQEAAAIKLAESMDSVAKATNASALDASFALFTAATEKFASYVDAMNAGGRLEIGIEPITINVSASSNIFDAFGKQLKADIYSAIKQSLQGSAAGGNPDPASYDSKVSAPEDPLDQYGIRG